MRRGRRARGGTPRRVALAAVLTVAAACTSGGGDGGTPKPTFAIVFMGALTGDLAPLVIGSSRGAELAVEQANAAGDLPVVLRFEAQDTRAHPDRASTLAGRVAEDPDVIGVVGPANSGESYLAGTILDGAGVPFVTPSATDPGLSRQGWTHWFRAVGNNLSQGAPAGRLLAARAARGAFVAHDRTADGLALARGAGRELRRAGRLAGFAAITPGQPSYGGLVRRVRASGADAFFWGGFAPEAVVLVRGLRRAGFRGDFLITGEARNDVFLAAGRAARGALATCLCADVRSVEGPEAEAFVAAYRARWGEDPPPWAAEGYDAAVVVIDAVRRAGAPGADVVAYRDAVTRAIAATVALGGVTKTYAFAPTGELTEGAAEIFLYRATRNGYASLGTVRDATVRG